jgi:cytosine/adenosine deaminase-related metal-dependent hydrolase
MAAVGAKLVWSPQSNLALYGKTTDIKAAKAAGVKFAIGVDWNPTGSDSLFDELRVADTVNREEFDGAIPDTEWLQLITSDAADVLGLTEKIGRIKQGLKADLIALQRRDADVNQSLLKNLVQDVQLVIVGGKPLYGSRAALLKLRPEGCESLTIHGSAKRICVRDDTAGVDKAGETLADLQQILSRRYSSLAPLAP